MNNTFLAPIEKPSGLIMKLAYYMTREEFGKVLTPLKVHSARLPPAFGLFYNKIGKLDKKLLLPSETALLILRTRDLRDRLACCQRARLQYDQYRPEHSFGHAL